MKTTVHTATTPALLLLVEKFLEDLGDNIAWSTQNALQEKALEISGKLGGFGGHPVFKGFAHNNPNELNAFLKRENINIQMSWEEKPGNFGVASAFNVQKKWRKGSAVKQPVSTGYKGIKFNSIARIQVFEEGDDAIYEIPFDGGKIHIMEYPSLQVQHPLHLHALAMQIAKKGQVMRPLTEKIIIPQVAYNHKIDGNDALKWLTGIVGIGGASFLPVIITQAFEEVVFEMDEAGFSAKGGSAAAVTRSSEAVREITNPFILSLWLDGLNFPVLVGHFCQDSWQR